MEPNLEQSSIQEIGKDIEKRLLEIKMVIQSKIIAEILGGNPKEISFIFQWIDTNGKRVDTFLHTHLELLDLYDTDPDQVLSRVREVLEGIKN